MQPVSYIVSLRMLPFSRTSYRQYNFCRNTLGMKGRYRAELDRSKEIFRNLSKLLHTENFEEKSCLAVDTEPVIRKIVDCVGIDVETLNEAFRKERRLLNVHPSLWETGLKSLRACGFSGKECIHMLVATPSLLQTKPEVILSGMKNWKNTALGDQKLISLLTSCPQLLFVERHEINRRIPVLKSLSSQNNCSELLKRYPDFMFVDWSDFLAKMNYVEEEMKISRSEISKCDLLSCSLLELKTRHMVLERTGKYFPTNPKLAEHLQKKNPSLRQIVDSDDVTFSTKLAGLTVEEFEVFRELYEVELNETVDYSDSD